MKRLRLAALFMVVALAISACATGTKAPGTPGSENKPATAPAEAIKIGLAVTLTGSGALVGQTAANGARLAVAQINAAGGVNGRQLQLLEEDTGLDNTSAVNAVNRLISNGIVALVGPLVSTQGNAIGPIVVKEQIPTIIRGVTVDIKPYAPWVYRFASHGRLQSLAMVTRLVDDLGLKKIAIVYSNDEYGKANAAIAQGYLKDRGLQPVAVEAWGLLDKEFSAQLAKLRDADGVVQLGIGDGVALMMKQRTAMGIKAPWASTAIITNQATLNLFTDEDVNGAYVALEGTFASNESDLAKKMKQEFQAKFKETPDTNSAIYYDGVFILTEAIKKAGSTDKVAVRDALKNLKGLEGVNCVYNMDADGESCQMMGLYQFDKKTVKKIAVYDFGKK
ncbi:MAG: hypothetical protein JWN15_2792 [Firmicutes bacterium]|nr:hypothetical protein [Bacillota bacterium]